MQPGLQRRISLMRHRFAGDIMSRALPCEVLLAVLQWDWLEANWSPCDP